MLQRQIAKNNRKERNVMDISKWKSMAISKQDHTLLKAEGKKKFRGPAAMFAKIFHDYLEFQAKKHKKTKENYIRQLLMNEAGK